MILRSYRTRSRPIDENDLVQLLEAVSNSKPEVKVTFKRRVSDFDDLDEEEEEEES